MSARGAVWALVPAKSFALAKSRLAGALDPAARAAFARSMLEHVLEAASASGALAGTLVVTGDDEVAAAARARGADVSLEVAGGSLAAIVDAGLDELARRGAEGALVLMSDLPRLAASDVLALVEAMREADVVAAPDHGGEGTNALGVSPPPALRTWFGTRGSFRLHLARAEEAGLRVRVCERPGVAFDVDRPEDLAALRG